MSDRELRFQISLDGAESIEQALGNIGNAAQRAAAKVKKDFADVGKAFNDLGRATQTFAKRLTVLAGAATAAGAAAFALAKNAADAADQVGKAAEGAGLAVGEYQRLQFAAEQSGIAQSDFAAGITRLNQQIQRALEGTGAAGAAARQRFERLGVTLEDLAMQPVEEILKKMADGFNRLGDGVERSALGNEFFGRAVARWLPLMAEGAAGLERLGRQFEDLGLGFTPAQITLGTRFADTLNLLTRTFRALRHQVGFLFMQPMLHAMERLLEVVQRNREALLAFAEQVASRVTSVVTDFVNVLSGSTADVENIWVERWTEAVVDFGNALKSVIEGVVVPAARTIQTIGEGIAQALQGMGLNVSGTEVIITAALAKITGAFAVLGAMARTVIALLVFAKGHPIILGLSLLATTVAFLAGRQDVASRAAARHREALEKLRAASEAVNTEDERAVARHRDLIRSQLEAAKAAADRAEAMIRAELQIAEAQAVATGGMQVLQTDDTLRHLRALLGESQHFVSDIAAEQARFNAEVADFKLGAERLGEAADDVAESIDQVGAAGERTVTVWRGVNAEVVTLSDSMGKAAEGIGAAVRTVPEEFRSVGESIRRDVGEVAGDAGREIGALIENIRAIPEGFAAVVPAANEAAEAIRQIEATTTAIEGRTDALTRPFEEAAGQIQGIWQGLMAALQDRLAGALSTMGGAWTGLTATVRSSVDQMIADVNRLIARVEAAIAALRRMAAAQSSGGGGGGAQGFAGGGHVRGRGTGTSDSIPAWLSDGEFVLTAKATRYYGPALLAAMNRLDVARDSIAKALGGGELQRAVSRTVSTLRRGFHAFANAPGFNAGGLVDAFSPMMQPAFAGSTRNLNAGPRDLTPVNLSINGGPEIHVMATDDALEQIRRASNASALASAGRKPSHYRG